MRTCIDTLYSSWSIFYWILWLVNIIVYTHVVLQDINIMIYYMINLHKTYGKDSSKGHSLSSWCTSSNEAVDSTRGLAGGPWRSLHFLGDARYEDNEVVVTWYCCPGIKWDGFFKLHSLNTTLLFHAFAAQKTRLSIYIHDRFVAAYGYIS